MVDRYMGQHLINFEKNEYMHGVVHATSVRMLQIETMELLQDLQLQANYWVNRNGQRQHHSSKSVVKPSWEKEKAKLSSLGKPKTWE